MICPMCGNNSNPGERFCMKCGYTYPALENENIGVSGNNVSANNENTPNNKKKLIIILSIVAIVLTIVGIVLAVLLLTKDERPGYEEVVSDFCKAIEENDSKLYYEIEDESFKEYRETFSEIASLLRAKEVAKIIDDPFDEIVKVYAGNTSPSKITKVEYKIIDVDDEPDVTAMENLIEKKLGFEIDTIMEYAELFSGILGGKNPLEKLTGLIDGYSNAIKGADEAYEVKFEITVYGKKDKVINEIETSIVVLNNNGEWTMIPNFAALILDMF